jgi:ribosomal peptide maturation radical SAM protein 1
MYLSVALAAEIGPARYAALANAPGAWLLGERLLAFAAWGGPSPEIALGSLPLEDERHEGGATEYLDHMTDSTGRGVRSWGYAYELGELVQAAYAAAAQIEQAAAALVGAGYRIVGATTSYDQTAGAVALLAAVKRLDPSVRTVIGGANCEGRMAEAVARLSPAIDHVFAGEADLSFRAFLRAVAAGEALPRVVMGAPVEDMNALPPPDYADYLDQLREAVPQVLPLAWLAYETSRGCWWGEKQHCTFCGLNAMGMAYRAKDPDVVVRDLAALRAASPSRYVTMADNILPHGYHKTVVPRLATEVPGLHVFYEVKANLSLEQVGALARAGILAIQPGIESLSTPVLRLMRKGVLARQNVALLRYASMHGVLVKWNLLYAFPGDNAADYAAMIAMMPLLHHLTAPLAAVHLSIDRFSPYFDEADSFGVRDLRPAGDFGSLLPEGVDAAELAYHFEGSWESGSKDDPEVRGGLWRAVQAWRGAWERGTPVCRLALHGPGRWLLLDTRSGETRSALLTEAVARAALAGGPWDRVPGAAAAVRQGLAVHLDGWCVPLATGPVEVVARWEGERG